MMKFKVFGSVSWSTSLSIDSTNGFKQSSMYEILLMDLPLSKYDKLTTPDCLKNMVTMVLCSKRPRFSMVRGG